MTLAIKPGVVRSKFLLAEGVLQSQDGVIHVKATRLSHPCIAVLDTTYDLA
jgi:hypothetical protein